jgi:hypothetical protein
MTLLIPYSYGNSFEQAFANDRALANGDHALLNNLGYASAGHTGFVGLTATQTLENKTVTNMDYTRLSGATLVAASGTITAFITDQINEKTSNNGVNIDGILLKDNSIQASGSEQLKFYTYTRTLDATDNTNRYYVFTVTDVVSRANVRSITAVGVDSSDGSSTYSYTLGDSAGVGMKCIMSSTTACRVDFGTTYAADDQISITIVVAV